MLRLMLVLHAIIATSLMGAGITAALAAGYVAKGPILAAALGGFVLAFPASWLIARQIMPRAD